MAGLVPATPIKRHGRAILSGMAGIKPGDDGWVMAPAAARKPSGNQSGAPSSASLADVTGSDPCALGFMGMSGERRL